MEIKVIDSFRGKYDFLSNFYLNSERLSVEHKYQAAKATTYVDYDYIMSAESPLIAKRRGKTIPIRKDWNSIKLVIMRELLKEKFGNDDLRALLIETKNAILIEGNSWGDVFWGMCDEVGENHLGRILMDLRDNYFKNNEREY